MSNVCHVNIKLWDKAYSRRYTEKTFVHLCLVQNVRVFPNTSHKQTVNHHVHISRSLQTRCFYILNQFSLVLDHITQILEFISRHGSGEALDIIPYIPEKQKPSVWRESRTRDKELHCGNIWELLQTGITSGVSAHSDAPVDFIPYWNVSVHIKSAGTSMLLA